jgi:hypothetical protein
MGLGRVVLDAGGRGNLGAGPRRYARMCVYKRTDLDVALPEPPPPPPPPFRPPEPEPEVEPDDEYNEADDEE